MRSRLAVALGLSALLSTMAGCASRPAAFPRSGAEPAAPIADEARRGRAGLYIAGAVAVVGAATSIGCTVAGELENQSIKDGGFATGADIQSAADSGDTFNQVAFVTGAVALGALGAAIGLYMYGAPPEPRKAGPKAAKLPRIGFEF